MNKQLTAEQLIKRYKGKYIDVYPTFDYMEHRWFYKVMGVSKTLRENYNLPEDCMVKGKERK
jgi:hypothetical protein